ncbi:tubulin delta chain-like [Chlorella sorokiniana]|uniref:Tubulin delta chain n=1 Tax=Chlorella sorokiniana TaxID=3076 RepID=A0A2P6TW83_CHLSO|nr:tubulin delta chain-like [Chlorella sorokiniana]|eukprot:PRW58318.1 tubulin delta chain-like [Chlorella sorokiniana]
MSIITLQIGQAGCQGGAALFQQLAAEAALPAASSGGSEWSEAADRFFALAPAGGGPPKPTARALLVDMEPKAVAAVQQAATSIGTWQYSRVAALARQPGSGNNWAAGALGHAPAVRQQVLGMVRRQAERCDSLGGFLVMQSLAGGTGSGLGSALVTALRDEYGPSCRILSHAIWPHEAGEVVTQPYNALLSLASLAEHASGVVIAYNDELSAACQQKLGIQRPGFADLNAVAAHSLASLLLPATQRQAPEVVAAPASARPQLRGGGRGRLAWDTSPAEATPARQQPAAPAAAWDGTFSSGSRWEDEEAPAAGNAVGRALDPLADVCGRLCSQPPYRLLSLRSCPQLPPSSFDFTPFSWPTVLKELKQAQQAGGTAPPGAGLGSLRRGSNRSLASLLVLRGDQASTADVSEMADAALFSSHGRHASRLAVATSSSRMAGQQMLATLLSNDQTPVAPLERMLTRARRLFDARAFVHRYERHGLACPADFDEAFEATERLLDAYRQLSAAGARVLKAQVQAASSASATGQGASWASASSTDSEPTSTPMATPFGQMMPDAAASQPAAGDPARQTPPGAFPPTARFPSDGFPPAFSSMAFPTSTPPTTPTFPTGTDSRPAVQPQPFPDTATAPAGGMLNSATATLDAHNAARAAAGVAPLSWSDSLASYAAGVSATCRLAHSGGLYGENLFIGSNARTCKVAVDAWMTEASARGGHYTQASRRLGIVYPASTQVGCAIASCGMVTCSYDVIQGSRGK